MSRILEFLRECNAFFVLTINNDFPAGRPFGAVMEIDGDLYISTADTKAVYEQIKENGHIQFACVEAGHP